jgi:hypothetical protein
MARLVRWLLVLPASVAAWYLALVVGIGLHLALDSLCPPEQTVSGLCIAPWHAPASQTLMAFGAGLAALLVMLTCTFLAPTHRRQVAIATFIVGALVASIMGLSASALGPMVAAILVGAVTLTVILRRLPSLALPNNSLERTREG